MDPTKDEKTGKIDDLKNNQDHQDQLLTSEDTFCRLDCKANV